MAVALTPIDRRLGVGRQVHDAIVEAIVSLDFKPGHALSENNLARELGASL